MALPFKIDVLPEPEVEFANGSHDVDPRRGLAKNGPADNRGLRTVRWALSAYKMTSTPRAAG